MTSFIAGESRTQATLFPERLDDFIAEDNPVRVIDILLVWDRATLKAENRANN
jgi:hypothetical protein